MLQQLHRRERRTAVENLIPNYSGGVFPLLFQWAGTAMFQHLRSLPLGSPGFEGVNAGTRVVPSADGTWYLFGRRDAGNSTAGAACPVTSEINGQSSAGAAKPSAGK